eukprot:TRINITY_DN11247_c0_g1_i2.p2 TRINITY_DN11247_c0_g1~~TRINITY_DN11247_c0_g1_i2.p2  ORF type:complete len:197 (+),score=57.90 TRINITY_DN11247_c0_g1_i2:202-792(+)
MPRVRCEDAIEAVRGQDEVLASKLMTSWEAHENCAFWRAQRLLHPASGSLYDVDEAVAELEGAFAPHWTAQHSEEYRVWADECTDMEGTALQVWGRQSGFELLKGLAVRLLKAVPVVTAADQSLSQLEGPLTGEKKRAKKGVKRGLVEASLFLNKDLRGLFRGVVDGVHCLSAPNEGLRQDADEDDEEASDFSDTD